MVKVVIVLNFFSVISLDIDEFKTKSLLTLVTLRVYGKIRKDP